MAIYHLSYKTITRSKGQSAVAAAAYRAGESLELDGVRHSYEKKPVGYKAILLPDEAPSVFLDRETLWVSAERSESRSNSRVAREVCVALPVECTVDENVKLARQLGTWLVSHGCAADVCIHDQASNNPHAHILFTTRRISRRGLTDKIREFDSRQFLRSLREMWAQLCNTSLAKRGAALVSELSNVAMGKGLATVHVGRRNRRGTMLKFCNQAVAELNQHPESSWLSHARNKFMLGFAWLSALDRYSRLSDIAKQESWASVAEHTEKAMRTATKSPGESPNFAANHG